MKTICRDCVFAQYDESKQTGCALGRLDRYRKINRAELVDTYYEIDGLCNACTKENPDGMPDFDTLKETVERRSFSSNTFILPIKTWDDQHINHFIERGRIQAGNPELLIVFASTVSDKQIHCIPHPVKTMKILRPELNGSILNFAIKQSKTQLLTLIEPGNIIPANLNQKVNEILNFELKTFGLIKNPSGYNGMVIQTVLAEKMTLNDIIKLDRHTLTWQEWNQESAS